MSEPEPEVRSTRSGPGKVLVAVYGVFALAACARAGVQIATRFDEAPLAYLLSAFAGVIYVVATIMLARGTRTSRKVATVAIVVELVGVLTVGTLSVLDPGGVPPGHRLVGLRDRVRVRPAAAADPGAVVAVGHPIPAALTDSAGDVSTAESASVVRRPGPPGPDSPRAA